MMNNYGNPFNNYQRNTLFQPQTFGSPIQGIPYSSNPPYQQPHQPQFRVMPVGSVDEARANPVDPGMPCLYPDTGTGKVYLKMFNTTTGKSDLFTYVLEESPAEQKPQDPMQEIKTRLSGIEQKIGVLYESISGNAKSNAGNAKPDGGYATAASAENAAAEPTTV